MVDYDDGSVLAQLGNPDMRTPIAYGLAWPERIDSGVDSLDLLAVARLDFEPPDLQRFPCLRLAYEAWEAGGTASTVLNAANEVAVQAFLEGALPFTGIPRLIEDCLGHCANRGAVDLESILAADAAARALAREQLAGTARSVTG
jgi:1-deoxy-D-xylulose-5-phosphate reductoisomerase